MLSALGGSVLVYLLSPINSATAGASGAIFGLFGATFALARRLNIDVKWVVGLIVLNLAFTFLAPAMGSQPISWQGHVGGLITGAAIGAAYAYAPRAHRNLVQAGVSVAALVLFAALVWWRTVSSDRGGLGARRCAAAVLQVDERLPDAGDVVLHVVDAGAR